MALPEQFKKAYQILSWVSLAGLIVVIVLVLRKSPAPDVPNDPNAAARAEPKLQAADLARAAGRPAQVALDRTELNSYLAENLQVEGARVPVEVDAVGGGKPRPTSAPAGGAAASDPEPTLEDVQSSVKDVKVDMVGDVVKAYVLFDFHGKDMTLELDGHLTTEGGYMKIEPISGMLGSMPLPQSVLNSAVEKMMASPENRD